ncbi:hypothetical protein [Nocardia cyriacigeorgica]|uniref:hypothetical protein n=1 Tax=Nocardia cyriacigeorgica TaxID=135487 RepID=UPI002456B139|nr:hypothetical protein [Nocardia cyriacigeorgica]
MTQMLASVAGIDLCAAREGAERILRAGWRPPARRIETAEELDTLPINAVILAGGELFSHLGRGWWEGRSLVAHSEQIVDAHDSAVVLWEPEQESGQ